MIIMICGSTSINGTIYSAESGAFKADEATEQRLVSLGVAKFVGNEVATAADSVLSNGAGADMPKEEGSVNGGSEPISDKPEYSIDTDIKTLRAIAKEAGITVKVGMAKKDIVEALDEYYYDDDGDDMPGLNLTADGIVT